MPEQSNKDNNNKPSLTEIKNNLDIFEDYIYEDLLLTLEGVRQKLPDDIGVKHSPTIHLPWTVINLG